MTISQSTLKEFAKAVTPPKQKSEGTMVTGTAKEYDGGIYVQIDGSEQLTPIASSTAGIKDGDRITVMVKDHKVTATGNVSMPSTNQGDLDDLHSDISGEFNNKIGEFEEVIADKATIEELEAQTARIDTLTADNVTIKETLTAETARINELEANKANITDLEAINAHITNLEADMLTAEVADITYAKIDDLEAVTGDFYTLQSDYANFKTVTADDISANSAKIEHLESTMITSDNLDAKYANIDFANIGEAAIEKLFADSGIIGDLVMSDGHVTGTLVGVTIKGDLIEGGTVVADKLVIKGEDGLFYKLNTDGVDISAEQTEYNSLNGSVITAKSITAEKVNVDDLVAFGATIGGFNIDTDSLYSGVKSSVDNTTSGVYMDDTGQFSLGNATDYLKFYKDGSNWKLDISASSIKFGSSSTSLEQTITNIQNAAEAAEEAASNANSNASDAAEKADQLEQSLNDYKDVVAGSYATKAELENSGNSILATVEENYQIKGDYVTDEESALVLEGSGGVVQIGENAGLPPEGVTVYGQTRQNLWVNPAFENTKGLTASSNSNGSITISGTVTDDRYAVSSSRIYTLKPNTEYTLSIDKKVADSYSNTGTGACFYVNLKDEAGEYLTDIIVGYGSVLTKTFTTPSNLGRAACCFTAYNGTTISGTYRIMLNEGSEAEPWCVPGVSSVSEVVLLTANANLAFIDPSNITGSHAGVTTTVDEQGWVTWTGTPTLNAATGWGNTSIFGHIPAGTVLKAAVEGDPQYCYFGVNYVLSGSSTHYATTLYSGAVTPSKPWTVPEGVSYVYVFLAFKGGVQGETINERLRLSIYIGDEPVFEPGNYRSKEIPLLGNPLRSLPDGTRDELHIDADGEVTLTKRVGLAKLGGLSWSQYGKQEGVYGCHGFTERHGIDYFRDDAARCSALYVEDVNWNNLGGDNSVALSYDVNWRTGCLVKKTSSTDAESLKSWLTSSGAELVYLLETPQTLPLGKVDLPALNAPGATVWTVASDSSGNAYTLEPDIHAIWYAENASALKNFASKAELKVESDQIKATVEETYSTKEEVSAVEDKADAAQDDLDAYKTTVSTTYATKSEVTQTADSIKSEVAATYTSKEEFEGLEIGGRNLIANTENMPIGPSHSTKYWAYAGTAPVDTGDGIKLSFDGSVNRALTVPLVFDGAVENGETVTLSFDYRGNITDFGSFYFMMRTTPNVSNIMADPSSISETEWSHYKWTFSNDDANARTCYFILLFYALAKYDSTKWIEIKKGSLKLEKGTKATDWSPAPEDMLSTADASETYATKQSVTTVEQTVDGLKSTVSSNYTTLNNKFGSYYTKTEVDQKDNSIKSTVSSVQTTANNALEKASTVEQTASGLEVRLTQAEKDVDTAQSTANTAKTNAATAQSTANTANSTANTAKTNAATAQNTANAAQDAAEAAQSTANAAKTAAATAQTTATNAAKTATNYLKFDSSGLCVGNMTGTLQGNTLITSDGVKIRNGTTVLASFTASEVQLGGASSSIQFGDYAHVTGSNSGASFGYGSIDGDQGSFLQLKNNEVTLQWPRVGTGGVKVTGLRFHTNTNQSFSGGKLYHQDRYLDGTSGTTYQYFCGRRLYYNASGTTGNVTLAESAANFYFIDIFFTNNDNYRDYVRVYAPNGNSAVLSNSVYKNEYTTTYVRNKVVTISGTSISVVSNRNGEAQVRANNSCYATDSTSVIKIYAVWGWQ